jgi:hypothetical protein
MKDHTEILSLLLKACRNSTRRKLFIRREQMFGTIILNHQDSNSEHSGYADDIEGEIIALSLD